MRGTFLLTGAFVIVVSSGQGLSPYDLNRVKPGQVAPDFTLPAHTGGTISLSGLRGKNVVLVFYRGYWWPYCTQQLVELHSLLPEQRKADTVVLAVSPDPPDKIGETVAKVRSKTTNEFGITLLSDADHRVIDHYGLLNETAAKQGRYLPHPTTYIIDKAGTVRWKFTEKDFKVRPDNAAILQELNKLPWHDAAHQSLSYWAHGKRVPQYSAIHRHRAAIVYREHRQGRGDLQAASGTAAIYQAPVKIL
jgi:peroxiredoxin